MRASRLGHTGLRRAIDRCHADPRLSTLHGPVDTRRQPAVGSVRQDEVEVAELVPAVALGEGGGVGRVEQSRPATASISIRCDASGSCQPLMMPSTTCTPRSGVMTSSVQP